LHCCFTSPLLRAQQTGAILAEPHGLPCLVMNALMEADLGRWEGLDWPTIQAQDPVAYEQFHGDPGSFGHPDGESYREVLKRVRNSLEPLFDQHHGRHILVVSHQVVLRAVLTHWLGRPLAQAREIKLANGSISVVMGQGGGIQVQSLNLTSHLENLESLEKENS
jgi:broad specificity phosphatase PhoE